MTIMDNAEMSHGQALYLEKIRRRERFIRHMRYIILIAIIGLWELFASIGLIDPFIASSPSRIVSTIVRLYQGGELFLHIGVTLFETVVGFVLGTVLGSS